VFLKSANPTKVARGGISILPRLSQCVLLLALPSLAFGATVSLLDTATQTSSTIYVNDQFTLSFTGPANSAITYTEFGVTQPPTGWSTNASGTFSITLTAPSSPASYSQVWSVGGVVATPNPLVFTVASVPTPSVSVVDLTTNNHSTLTIGDQFQFSLTGGKPNTAITYVENGIGPYTPPYPAKTDSSGNYTFTTAVPSPPKSFSQVWTVGGANGSPNPLVFTVVAPLSVSVVDLTTNSHSTLTIGDQYTFSLTGGTPYTAITYMENGGGPFTPPSPAQTDSNGNYSFTLAVPSPPKTYSQVWKVGSVIAPPNPLVFSAVNPPTPTITSISQASGPVGTSVTINGTNFGSAQGSSVVSFGGVSATPTSWISTRIVALVPTEAISGVIAITVLGFQSSGVAFQVTSSPSCGSFQITQISPGDRPPGITETFSFASARATSLYFAVVGATSNPYNNQVTSPSPASPFTATLDTTSLLGLYKVTPVATNAYGTSTCNERANVFTIGSSATAPTGSQDQCESMTGSWTDTSSGQPTFTWTLTEAQGSAP
jgi:hypothetical protein